MKRATPEQAGHELLGTSPALGRALCFRVAGGELLRVAEDDAARKPLRWAMARGIGSIAAAGVDEQGLWFVRSFTGSSLSHWLDHAPKAPAILRVFAAIARCLDACERADVFPGPLLPGNVLVEPERLEVELLADAWLEALLGAEVRDVAAERSNLRFFPPEQASGAPWDGSANRYVFGLLLYEFLAGEPAFAGQGLRLSLEQRAQRLPAAFSAAKNAELPVGLQSFCLRLLDPERERRPASAAEIVNELGRFVGSPRTLVSSAARVLSAPSASAPLEAVKSPTRRRARWSPSLFAFAAACALIALALGVRYRAQPEAPRSLLRPALRTAQSVLDCQSCHPRHSAEWSGSVMAHAATSPLFQALEQLIEEQIGRDNDCASGAGILRPAGAQPCRDRQTGAITTGSGGEGWCSNCHLPSVQLTRPPRAFEALSSSAASRAPLAELVPASTLEGISCVVCHQAAGPVPRAAGVRGEYVGNAFWTSPASGRTFAFRPEDARGELGISNSGYRLDPRVFLAGASDLPSELVAGGAHRKTPATALRYQRSSEFCGSCHDVRLFGTDALNTRGEHFKRLRNGYSEWSEWAASLKRRGRQAPGCADCHLSSFPGVCVADAASSSAASGCPPGTRFEARPPGSVVVGRMASNSAATSELHPHYFTGVDVPLDPRLSAPRAEEALLDAAGIPAGPRARRDLLLASALDLAIEPLSDRGGTLTVPIAVENVGAGHRVPAGFSQEREIWVHLSVRDARGQLVYEVGRVDRADEDLADKRFLRVTTDDGLLDAAGRPQGLFGADVADGPDLPRWSPRPDLGGNRFRGQGLINFQNGFLRCVRCIGRVDSNGVCRASAGQETTRAARFADGDYDPETGSCVSNLAGRNALFETYFPVGALDAERGVAKAPDAIIDTRSLPPGERVLYVYELDMRGARGPFSVRAELLFRAFPPYLLRAFIDYEKRKAARGLRPNGPLIDERALERLEIVTVKRGERSGGSR